MRSVWYLLVSKVSVAGSENTVRNFSTVSTLGTLETQSAVVVAFAAGLIATVAVVSMASIVCMAHAVSTAVTVIIVGTSRRECQFKFVGRYAKYYWCGK